jgi:hypothetical protein
MDGWQPAVARSTDWECAILLVLLGLRILVSFFSGFVHLGFGGALILPVFSLFAINLAYFLRSFFNFNLRNKGLTKIELLYRLYYAKI